MCRERECEVFTQRAEHFKNVVVFKVLECLCMRVLTGVLVLFSLMGKIETNITVIHPGIFGHTDTCTAGCLGKTATHLAAPY